MSIEEMSSAQVQRILDSQTEALEAANLAMVPMVKIVSATKTFLDGKITEDKLREVFERNQDVV